MKATFAVLMVTASIGNFLYAAAPTAEVALLGRIISGIGAASVGLGYAYISLTTTIQERVGYMSSCRFFSSLGLLISPGASIILDLIDIRITDTWAINKYTSPGIFTCILCLIAFGLVMWKITNPPQQSFAEMEDMKKRGTVFITPAILCAFFFFFCNGMLGTSQEYLGRLVTGTKYGWTNTDTSILMIVVAVLAIITVPFVKFGHKFPFIVKYGERVWCVMATVGAVVSFWLGYMGTQGRFWDYGNPADCEKECAQIDSTDLKNECLELCPNSDGVWWFCVGNAMSIVSYMFMSLSLIPMFSKLIKPSARLTMMPWQTAFLALGRIFSPLWCDFAWELQDTEQSEILYGSLAMLYGSGLVLWATFWPEFTETSWMKYDKEGAAMAQQKMGGGGGADAKPLLGDSDDE